MSVPLPLAILYSDESLVVVEKPGGLLSVPGRGPAGADSVVARLQQLRPRCMAQPAVHRLDMDTSGLMVLALTRAAHRHLSAQFAKRQVVKHYAALLEGLVSAATGEIALPFRLDPDNRPRQIYDPLHGKLGISRWHKLAACRQRTLVAFRPLTGRTHQLRLHASHPLGLGCPIVGDRLYGTRSPGEQLLLHAAHLAFRHPDTAQWLQFCSPPPFAPAFLASLDLPLAGELAAAPEQVPALQPMTTLPPVLSVGRGLDLRHKVYALRVGPSCPCLGMVAANYHIKQDTRVGKR